MYLFFIQVAELIDKKAKFFLKKFPSAPDVADEDPFTGIQNESSIITSFETIVFN